MGDPYAGGELFFAKTQRLAEVGSEKRYIILITAVPDFHSDGQHGREADNVVMPESAADSRKISFVKECAIARRFEIDATDFHVKGVFLRSDDQISTVAAQFTIDFVADVGGYGDHCGSDRYAQRDRDARQNLATRLVTERF